MRRARRNPGVILRRRFLSDQERWVRLFSSLEAFQAYTPASPRPLLSWGKRLTDLEIEITGDSVASEEAVADKVAEVKAAPAIDGTQAFLDWAEEVHGVS